MVSNIHDILHDHYKDTFAYIRERERQRDRLFLVVVALLAFHVLLMRYAVALPEIAASFEAFGMSVEIQRVPLPAVVSLSWTLLATITLRYFQVTAYVDKQYDYLHTLERRLSLAMGEDGIISREGGAYFSGKGVMLRHTTWVFYLAIFPVVLLAATVGGGVIEWCQEIIPMSHKLYDTVIGAFLAVAVSLFAFDIWRKRVNGS